MDKYIDGYIYLNVKFINRPSQMLYDKAYPCPQPHPFKDGDDVTGRYMVASDGSAFQLYQAKPIHSGEPTATEEKEQGDDLLQYFKKEFGIDPGWNRLSDIEHIVIDNYKQRQEQGDDWVTYEITLRGELKLQIEVARNDARVIKAMNGWGNAISLKDFTVTKLPPPQQ